MSKILAIYDIRGIQNYIFRTNKLKEIMGVSSLPEEIFKKGLDFLSKKFKFSICYEDSENDNKEYDLEIIDTKGGNSIVLYKNEELYKMISKNLAIYVFDKSYSLSVAYAGIEINDNDNFSQKYDELKNKLGDIKVKMPIPMRIGAFPIVMTDLVTGFPVTEFNYIDGRKEFLSEESKIKRNYRKNKKKENPLLEFIELDDMVFEKGIDSHIAIIHIDGNNMGSRINDIIKSNSQNYKTAKKAMKNIIVRDCFKETCEFVIEELKKWKNSDLCKIPDKEKKTLIYEIIQAGDDITFICNAMIALPLCEMFLKNVSKKYIYKNSKDENHKISSCAGISIINSHFPFSDGYKVSEKCCQQAKKRAKQNIDSKNGFIGNWIDFEICGHISAENSDNYRKKHYLCKDNSYLLMRPYNIECDNKCIEKYKYSLFKERISECQKLKRSWAKNYRDAYYKGQYSAEFLHNRAMSRNNNIKGDIYDECKTAIYYDALEIMDYFINIDINEDGSINIHKEAEVNDK